MKTQHLNQIFVRNSLILIFISLITFSPLAAQTNLEKWHALITEGQGFYKVGDYAKALVKFKKASQIIPTDTLAYHFMLDCGSRIPDAANAQYAFNQLKYISNNTELQYRQLIQAYKDENKMAEANTYLNEALSKYTNSQKLMYLQLGMFMASGNMHKADSAGKVYITKFPQDAQVHALLIGFDMNERNDKNAAIGKIQTAISIFPDSVMFRKLLYTIYLQEGKYDSAEVVINEAIKFSPNDPELYYNLALIYFDKKDFKKSAEICEKAIEIKPDYLEAIYNVGTFYYYEGLEFNEIVNVMTLEEYSQDGRAYESMALQSLKKAQPYFEKAIKLNPDELDAYENLNTIKSLIANLEKNIAQELVVNMQETKANNNKSVVENAFEPEVNIDAFTFEYPSTRSETQELMEGQTGFLNISVNAKYLTQTDTFELVLIQPIVTPGLIFNEKNSVIIKLDSLQVTYKVPVSYSLTDAETQSIERAEDADTKIRFYLKDGNQQMSSVQELTLKLGKKSIASVPTVVSEVNTSVEAETEDFVFVPFKQQRDFLIILAANDYLHFNPLSNAVADAKAFKNILVENYGIDSTSVYELYNNDLTHEKIRNLIIKIKNIAQPTDNVIIYYAGHGMYDPEFDEGAWIPVDAQEGQIDDYIPNSRLVKYLNAINVKHLVLIADACFSGALFVSGDVVQFAKNDDTLPSRWGFSSGNIEYVMDGTPGKHSPFAEALLTNLSNTSSVEIPISELISTVSTQVRSLTKQSPIGRPLAVKGNAGGEFIFHKKN